MAPDASIEPDDRDDLGSTDGALPPSDARAGDLGLPSAEDGGGCECVEGVTESRPTAACGEETRTCADCAWSEWLETTPGLEDPECKLGEALFSATDPALEDGCSDGLVRRYPCVACAWASTPSECGGGCPGTRRVSPADSEEVCVPAGTFVRGCEDSAASCSPRHEVYLDEFYVDRFVVTVRRYQECVDAGECSPLTPFEVPYRASGPAVEIDDLSFDDPEVIVWSATHDQAEAFCSWDGGRLVTGAEWERAALGTWASATLPWMEGRDPATQFDICDGIPIARGCSLESFYPFPPRNGIPYGRLLGAPVTSSIGLQNLWWYFEWTSDSLEAPYAPASVPDINPSISDGPPFELRGGVFESYHGRYTRDIAVRDATRGEFRDWGQTDRGAIRCARRALGAR